MKTKQQIEDKLNEMIAHMAKSTRLSTSEKDQTEMLLKDLKHELIEEKNNCEREIERLSSTELYSQIDMNSGTIIRFRPRNTLVT